MAVRTSRLATCGCPDSTTRERIHLRFTRREYFPFTDFRLRPSRRSQFFWVTKFVFKYIFANSCIACKYPVYFSCGQHTSTFRYSEISLGAKWHSFTRRLFWRSRFKSLLFGFKIGFLATEGLRLQTVRRKPAHRRLSPVLLAAFCGQN